MLPVSYEQVLQRGGSAEDSHLLPDIVSFPRIPSTGSGVNGVQRV